MKNNTGKEDEEMLTITLDFVKGSLLIRLKGSLTKKTVEQLITTMDEMIYEKGISNIIINLEETSYISDTTIENLLTKYRDIVLKNGKIIICGYNNLKSLTINNFIKNNYLISNNELSALKMINI